MCQIDDDYDLGLDEYLNDTDDYCINNIVTDIQMLFIYVRPIRIHKHMSAKKKELLFALLSTIGGKILEAVGDYKIDNFVEEECLECLHHDGCTVLPDMINIIKEYMCIYQKAVDKLGS